MPSGEHSNSGKPSVWDGEMDDVENDPEFIEISKRIDARLGLADELKGIDARIAELLSRPQPLSDEDAAIKAELMKSRHELAAEMAKQKIRPARSEEDRLANAERAVQYAKDDPDALGDAIADLCYVRQNMPERWIGIRTKIRKVAAIGPVLKAMDAWDKDHKRTFVPKADLSGSGFTPMGFNDGSYYFMTDATQEVVALPAKSLAMISELLRLSELTYWKDNFYTDGGTLRGADAANFLMRECEKRGLFDPSMIRGRGIWIDEGRVIAHLGDRLVVDGVESSLTIGSKFRYVRRPPLDVDLSSPLSTEEGKRFLSLVETGAWTGGGLAARYMAGQVVCAAICGALWWRPHSWLTGRSQSGKSTMISIIKAALGNMLTHVLKTTTAAGIRQIQRGDALATLYDEADADTDYLKSIVQGVVDLARIASGEDGGIVAKGTTHGDAIAWTIRSCFILASVNATLIQESDKTRFEVSELDIEKHAQKTSAEFEAARVALLTDGFGARFCARAIKLAPTIRSNAKMFSAALVPILTKQRSSDMHGALLAGAYSLESEEVLTLERAQALVSGYGIAKVKPMVAERDEVACWQYILQCRIPVLNTDERQEMLQVSTLIDIAASNRMTDDEYLAGLSADGFEESSTPIKVNESEARIKLRSAGFKVDRDGDGKLCISVSIESKDIADMLKPKPQWTDYKNVLKRIKGAKMSANSVSFGSKGNKHYAVVIPHEE